MPSQRLDRLRLVARVAQLDLEPLAAHAGLELVGGALGDHLAVVDDAIRSASRSASSRYCVVSRTVVPSATRASIVSHRPTGCAGPGPWWARRGRGRAGARRARRRGPAGGACRRSRCSRGGRRRRPARSARAARRRARAPAACRGGRGGRPCRGSRSRSGSRRRPRTGRRARSGRAAPWRSRRRPGRRRAPCPTSGSSRVVRMRTAVVLPGAVGAEQAEHGARPRRADRRRAARGPCRRTSSTPPR